VLHPAVAHALPRQYSKG